MDSRDIGSFVAAGGVAGAHTVTGIKLGDILFEVQDLTTGANLAPEYTITADDTVDNTGGTSTAGHNVLYLFEKKYGGGRTQFETGAAANYIGRTPY